MLTFLCLTVPEDQKEERRMVNGEIVNFNYPEVVADHYRYRGTVKNHNDLRHDDETKSQFGLESRWGTTWWPIWVFALFTACTGVNAYLAMKYLLKADDKFMDFQKEKKAKGLMNNSYTNEKVCGSPSNIRKRQLSHILETEPTHVTQYN